jgi:gamma-glutamyltranspeptidase / glutathione hydrolase
MAIATPHRLATQAGADVLRQGGNAVDAAVAAGLALAVVMPYANGLGGDLLALVHATEPVGYNGSGRAPLASSAQRLRDAGHRRMPARGPETVTVPGAVAGWFDLVERFGSRSFGAVSRTAVALARDGFELGERDVAELRAAAPDPPDAGWTAGFGRALSGGRLTQPALADLLAELAGGGPASFYRGSAAEAIVARVEAAGGALAMQDLERHDGTWVEPLSADWRGHRLHQLPPNSQGAHLLQALLMTGDRDRDPDTLIAACEAAMADRDAVLGDPERMTLTPRELLDPRHLADVRARRDAHRIVYPGGTVFLCCTDRDGTAVSLMQSNYEGFGSGLSVPELGIALHNRGACFSVRDGHPNELGPGRRPLHTLMPGLVCRDGAPRVLHGSMGGDAQVAINLQLLARLLVGNAAPRAALDAPRWRLHPDVAGALVVEQPLAGLARGRPGSSVVGRYDGACGHAQLITVEDGGCDAAADPRAPYGAAVTLD